MGDGIGVGDMLYSLGQVEASVENYEGALKYYRQAKDIIAEYGSKADRVFIIKVKP